MKAAGMRMAAPVLLGALLLGCAAQRPVLYLNDHLERVGQAQAEADIAECVQLAREAGLEAGKGEKVAKDTARAAAVGGATGAVVGAISKSESAGTGAAAGAAGAGVATLLTGLFRSQDLDPVTKRYVDTCLRERGYKVIGWK